MIINTTVYFQELLFIYYIGCRSYHDNVDDFGEGLDATLVVSCGDVADDWPSCRINIIITWK